MKYQSQYFQQHPMLMNTEGRLADIVHYSFNDILQLTAEEGLIGLILFLIILVFFVVFSINLFRTRELNKSLILNGVIGSVLIILVGGLFSYPFSMLPIKIIFYSSLAILSGLHDTNSIRKISSISIRKFRNGFLVTTSLFIGSFLVIYSVSLFNAFRKGKAIEINGYTSDSMQELGYNNLIVNKEPWYVLRKCDHLLYTGKQNQAITQLEQAKEITTAKALYFTLGELYAAKKEYNKAATQYLFLCHALPGLVKPKYLLAKLYYESGQYSKFETEANKLADFNPKVNSEEARNMIVEVLRLKISYRNNTINGLPVKK